jgi:ribosomal protein S27AE
LALPSKQPFSPQCDLHHTTMRRMVFEEDSEETRSYHACGRRDCTRVFRDPTGYSDLIEGESYDSRVSAQICPRCGAVLYLADVEHSQKIETWECPQPGCDFSDEYPFPSAR